MRDLVDLGDGYSPHIVSSIEGITMCGRAFGNLDVDERLTRREHVERATEAGDKPGFCFDCLVVEHGGTVHPRRREIHFSGGSA